MSYERVEMRRDAFEAAVPTAAATIDSSVIPVHSYFKVERESSFAYCVVVEKYFFIDREELEILMKNELFSSVYASNDAAHPGHMIIRFVVVKEEA